MAVRAVVVLELWLSMEVVVLRSFSSIRSVVSAVVRAAVLTAVAFAALPAVAQNPVLSDPTGTVGDANVVGTLPERFASRYKKGPLSMSFIGIERTNSEERLVIQLNRPAEFDLKTSPDGASVYVEIPTAQIPHSNNQNRLDATYFPGAIKLVQARSVRDIGGKRGIRVTIDLKSKALLESKIEGTNIVLIFRPS